MIDKIKQNASLVFSITILVAIVLAMFRLEYSNQEMKRQIEEDKLNMSEEELIMFEASQARCTKRTGSRPSCWQKKDWDIFFLEYCKRVSCQK